MISDDASVWSAFTFIENATMKNANKNGVSTKTQEIHLYPALQIRFRIQVQNIKYTKCTKCIKNEAPPKIDGDNTDIKIPANDNTKYTLEGKHKDLKVAEMFILC